MTIERLAAYIIVVWAALRVLAFLIDTVGYFLLIGGVAACFLFLGYYYLSYWRHTGFDYRDTWR